MRREARSLALAVLACLAGAGRVAGGEASGDGSTAIGLAHGDLAAWEGGAPVGWRVEVGARSGDGPPSSLLPVEGGGAALVGDAATGTWRLLAQTVAVAPGDVVRLRCEARAVGVKRDGAQRENLYVGLVPRGPNGPDMAALRPVGALREAFTPCEALARATTPALDIVAFLSTTGRLEVRDVRVERIDPAGAFDALVAHAARTYPFFAERGVDWAAHAAAFRARAVAAADDAAAFAGVLAAFLAPLRDVHVWIDRPGAARVAPYSPAIESGFDAKATFARLADRAQVGRIAIAGRLEGGIAYLAIGALPSPGADADALVAAHDRVRAGASAVVLDLRPCTGGNETTAGRLAAPYATAPVVYARRRVRNGPAADDFAPWGDAVLAPATEADRFAGSVVVLLGPACVSSGEGLAQMLEVLPTVTTVGRPTRGSSANPAPVPLPHGIDVWLPRWQNQRANGESLEGKGVAPKVVVEATGPGDPALERALEVLRAALAPKPPK
ncbi:MAG: S41 family peptidase [Planctomycetota bacterium]